jgi:hypothetical protein
MNKKSWKKTRGKRKTRKSKKRNQRGGALPEFIQLNKIFRIEFTPNEIDTLPQDYIDSNNKNIFIWILKGNQFTGMYSFLKYKMVNIVFNSDKFYFCDRFSDKPFITEVTLTDVSDMPRTDSEREQLESLKSEISRLTPYLESLNAELKDITEKSAPLDREYRQIKHELEAIENETPLLKPCPKCKK